MHPEEQQKNKHGVKYTSYTNDDFPKIHCTRYESGDTHCRKSGNKICGYFSHEDGQRCLCNHQLARSAYNSFVEQFGGEELIC